MSTVGSERISTRCMPSGTLSVGVEMIPKTTEQTLRPYGRSGNATATDARCPDQIVFSKGAGRQVPRRRIGTAIAAGMPREHADDLVGIHQAPRRASATLRS